MFPNNIDINGTQFTFVKQSRRGEVAIYTSGSLYARVGEKKVIEDKIALHKKFESFGFPVSPIVGQGAITAGSYYLEESLGEKCFSFLFQDDMKKFGMISPELFEKFLGVTEVFARAQLRSAISDKSTDSFSGLIGPKDLVKELPKFEEKILRRFDDAILELKVFPLVLTQGDFNPHNLFPIGVIDFEETYYGPFGYDLVTNIFSNNYFPETPGYEYIRLSSFTDEQKNLYYTCLDKICIQAGLPRVSAYREHFEFLRAIWLAKENHKLPKLQQWRYELFRKNYLE